MYLCDECCEVFEEKTEYETCPNCFSHQVVELDETEEANYQNEKFRNDPLSFGRLSVDEEQLFEMRAAFGEGETVVNVLTGETYKL